jgi:hypothetical protein
MVDTMKQCTKCQETKTLDAFYRRKTKGGHRPDSWCRVCRTTHRVGLAKKARAKRKPKAGWHSLTEDQRTTILAEHNKNTKMTVIAGMVDIPVKKLYYYKSKGHIKI